MEKAVIIPPSLLSFFSGINLTNRMWFKVVCTLIDNAIRLHSGQNVVDSRGAAEDLNFGCG